MRYMFYVAKVYLQELCVDNDNNRRNPPGSWLPPGAFTFVWSWGRCQMCGFLEVRECASPAGHESRGMRATTQIPQFHITDPRLSRRDVMCTYTHNPIGFGFFVLSSADFPPSATLDLSSPSSLFAPLAPRSQSLGRILSSLQEPGTPLRHDQPVCDPAWPWLGDILYLYPLAAVVLVLVLHKPQVRVDQLPTPHISCSGSNHGR
mmetsp:Transcript_16572/g.38060  ORF Transcript_16572/g.38060 Transcript_16572/m.38060 type:complete len:205 (-) Transcript_16572:1537-2151(-)